MRRRFLLALVILFVTAIAAPFAGPLSSGALLLLLSGHATPEPHDLPESYTPVHKGGVDLSTGMYTRQDEDLVLRETPHLVLRRMYQSGYDVPREFGVGTTHNGEKGLAGDGDAWQSILLYPTDSGERVEFQRISPGRSFANALFEHRGVSPGFQGARLGWVGFEWVMRLRDGSRLRFRKCTPAMSGCRILEERDADGHTIYYPRDADGRLLRMEASPDRWIAFDYDDRGRITRGHDSKGRQVRYAYDAGDRLTAVHASDGTIRRYTYTARNQMQTIDQPGIFIENTYNADGRVIRQVNRVPGEDEPYTFDFSYKMTGDYVSSIEIKRSDTTWATYTFNGHRQVMSESWGSSVAEPVSVKYERDEQTRTVTGLTVTCADRTGRQLPHPRFVRDDKWERERDDLISIYCSSAWRTLQETK